MTFSAFINSIKTNLSDKGLPSTLGMLFSATDKNSTKYNLLISLVAEHREIDNSYIAGTITVLEEKQLLSKIRGRVLRLIDSLESEDVLLANRRELSEDIGSRDLPSKILVVLNKMTPEIAAARLTRMRKQMLSKAKEFGEAHDIKELKAGKAKSKMDAFKKRAKKDIRLQKKYVHEFASAFKVLGPAYEGIRAVFEKVKDEFVILGLYQIQTAFANDNFDLDAYSDLSEKLDRGIEKYEEISKFLEERIDSNILLMTRYERELRLFEAYGSFNRFIESDRDLKNAFDQFLVELVSFRSGLNLYERELRDVK